MPTNKFGLKKAAQAAREGKSFSEIAPPPVEWDSIKSLRKTNIVTLAKRRDMARIEKKEATAEVKMFDDQIMPLIKDCGEKRILAGDVRITLCKGNSVKIDKKKLLLAGVDADVIVACTVSTPYDYIQTKPVEEEDEDDR